MEDRGLHRIEDELGEHWLTCWLEEGIAEIEAYLAKHAAFLSSSTPPSSASKRAAAREQEAAEA